MSSIFGLTATDLQKKLQPENGTETFLIDDDEGNLSEADAEEIIETWEEWVLTRIDKRYCELLTYVDGEILIRNAVGGETSLRLGIFPVIGSSVVLYKNFPGSRLWQARDRSLAMSGGFSVNESTGAVTLDVALEAGDQVIGEYGHTGASRVLTLRDAALSLAAVEVARRFQFFREESPDPSVFTDWKNDAFQNLNNLKGIPLLDKLELVRGDKSPGKFYGRLLLMRPDPA